MAFLKREADFQSASAFVARVTRDLQMATRDTRDLHHNELVPLDEADKSLFDSFVYSAPQSRGDATGWRRGRNKRGTATEGSAKAGNRTQSIQNLRPAPAPRPGPNEFARRSRVQSLLQTEDTLPTAVEQDFLYYDDETEQLQPQQQLMSPADGDVDEDELVGRVVYENDDEQVAAMASSSGVGDERGEYFSADRLASLSNWTTAPAPGPDSTRSPVRRIRDFGPMEGRSELLSEQLADRTAFGSISSSSNNININNNIKETRMAEQAAAVQINSASTLFTSLGIYAIIIISIFTVGL